MSEVVEHFGIGFLELLGGISITSVIIGLFSSGGIINNIVLNYFQRLCG